MKFASKVLLLAIGIVPLTAHAQIFNFKHVVVIFQENRTPDNLFQGLCAPPYGACAVPPTHGAIRHSNFALEDKDGDDQPRACGTGQHLRSRPRPLIVQCHVQCGRR